MIAGEQPAIVALCAWRENRGGGVDGMQSVLNVIANRAARRGTTLYEEAIRPLQFSSMTAPGDPELSLYPSPHDLPWQVASGLATLACEGKLADMTDGATVYYNPASIYAKGAKPGKVIEVAGVQIPFPKTWSQEHVKHTATIAGHVFFQEIA